ncbi:cytochrome c [Marinihelvus fidelis]|uniref:Cytochrome c n=1 Tax=Marinihelvus fidelis TaxID=2613842 RepID=A0A5N0TBJ0_9GAMM|nr:cytochrome c [Marinihelvus fidelis]KAA9132111.1 cytochrome c [Marinihelvus fidelis]
MNSTKTLAAVIGLAIALPQFAVAAGDAAAGKEKSVPCQACHGEDGLGIDPTYPKLAGQHADYLAKSLADYRDGRRVNPLMSGFATNLTDEDIEDLAAWYASLEGLKDLSEVK